MFYCGMGDYKSLFYDSILYNFLELENSISKILVLVET
jgi:hypothetical protein